MFIADDMDVVVKGRLAKPDESARILRCVS